MPAGLPQQVHLETASILLAVHLQEPLVQAAHQAARAVAIRPMAVPVQPAQVPTPAAVVEVPLILARTAAMADSREAVQEVAVQGLVSEELAAAARSY